jgi:hypothetical protein
LEWFVQMRGSVSVRAILFVALAVGSLGIKAAAGPTRDTLLNSDSSKFERSAISMLRAQGFTTSLRSFGDFRSTMVMASRGECRIAARNATWGSAVTEIYGQDARDIGPVSYLYRGHRYSAPPGLRIRLGRLEFEILDRLGTRPQLHVLTALATSPSCGGANFGLADVTLAT